MFVLHWHQQLAYNIAPKSGPSRSMNMDLALDFRLFCLAVRWPQRVEDAASLRDLIKGAPDWACVIEGAQRHLLAAQLLAGLQACGSAQVPDAAIAELRRQTSAARPVRAGTHAPRVSPAAG